MTRRTKIDINSLILNNSLKDLEIKEIKEPPIEVKVNVPENKIVKEAKKRGLEKNSLIKTKFLLSK